MKHTVKSEKDRVKPFTGAGDVAHLIGEAESQKGVDAKHEITHACGGDGSVNRTSLVADANAQHVSTAVEPTFFEGGQDGFVIQSGRLVVGSGLHFDISMEKYALKYQAKGVSA